MNTTHICLSRHGEADWNKQGILQGWLDAPIHAHGRIQVQQMACSNRAAGFCAVCSSPLKRVYETAQIISLALGLPAPCPTSAEP